MQHLERNKTMSIAQSSKTRSLHGTTTVPGDKSISHRALMLSSQAIGTSTIEGLLLGEDVMHTAEALRHLGVTITRATDGRWHVQGVGIGGFTEPDTIIDMGNAGTGARLMMGLVASNPITVFFTGDHSLRSRPMARVTIPLSQMGATITGRQNGRLPLAITGSASPLPIRYTLPVPSAQIKSAILLAGLNTPGNTTVIEPEATRDHTERMLRYFGATVEVTENGNQRTITVTGQPTLRAQHISVPGDPSSAAFLAVAALIVPGSDMLIESVCVNPLRIGLYTTLREMGGSIEFLNARSVAGEEVADIRVRTSALHGITVPAERAPSMIDEYPILSIAAACASGTMQMEGLAELKAKESDRLSAILAGLAACGITASSSGDDIRVTGCAGSPPGGGHITTHMDHRIAMAFLVLGMASEQPVTIDDDTMIQTSFPGFSALLNRLGAAISNAQEAA
jgi:3-phosphoshikimate 1-carboxyvinyltransferase